MDTIKYFTPTLRFYGFEYGWKENRLRDFSRSIKRVVPDSQAHIMMITAQNGFINQSDRYSFNNAGESLQKYIELHKGELAYNHGASKLRPFGSCFSLQIDKARIPYVYHCFSVKENDPEFISLTLNNKDAESQLRKIVTSGARMDGLLNISFEDYCSLNIKIPSLKEQQAIADFFKSLDSMITLTSKKIEKLKQTLTGCMQTMFPQESELEPKVRFREFEGKWEVKTLGDCFDERTERGNSDELLSVTMSRGVVKASENGRHDNSSNDKSNYKYVEKGDITYNSMRMWQGASGYAPYSGIVSPAYTVVCPKDKVCSEFFAVLFKTSHMIHKFRVSSQGLTSDTWNLKYPAFSKIKVIVPNEEEQQKIANYFYSLSEMISLQTKRLDLLKHIKSACLDNMFI